MYRGAPDLMQQVNTAVEQDPMRPHLATPEENYQYQDLVRRGLMMLADENAPSKDIGSPQSNLIKMVRNKAVPLEESMGVGLGEMMTLLYVNARSQDYEYDPSTVAAAMEELSEAYYMLLKARGAIAEGPRTVEDGGTPAQPLDLNDLAAEDELFAAQMQSSDYGQSITRDSGEGESAADDIDYNFSEEEVEFLDNVQLRATEFIGKYLNDNGMLDNDAWKKYAKDQVAREYESGALDDESVLDQLYDPGAVDQSVMGSTFSITDSEGGGNGMV